MQVLMKNIKLLQEKCYYRGPPASLERELEKDTHLASPAHLYSWLATGKSFLFSLYHTHPHPTLSLSFLVPISPFPFFRDKVDKELDSKLEYF